MVYSNINNDINSDQKITLSVGLAFLSLSLSQYHAERAVTRKSVNPNNLAGNEPKPNSKLATAQSNYNVALAKYNREKAKLDACTKRIKKDEKNITFYKNKLSSQVKNSKQMTIWQNSLAACKKDLASANKDRPILKKIDKKAKATITL